MLSALPESLARKIVVLACLRNAGKVELRRPHELWMGRYLGMERRFTRTSQLRLVNKQFARLLPRGEFAGLYHPSAVFFASDTIQFAFATAEYRREFGDESTNDRWWEPGEMHPWIFNRVWEFGHRINPGQRTEVDVLLDTLRMQWPTVRRSFTLLSQRRALVLLERWFARVDESDGAEGGALRRMLPV